MALDRDDRTMMGEMVDQALYMMDTGTDHLTHVEHMVEDLVEKEVQRGN